MRFSRLLFFVLPVLFACQQTPKKSEDIELLGPARQLTFAGSRTGEGYYSADGKWMVVQSERESDNPFYQIYLMNMENGRSHRISPGHGKTTCAWIHPQGKKVMFSSTHLDPQARQKQQEKLEERRSGRQKRYAWDYDEHYDIFETDLQGGKYKRLTSSRGYDAEGSYSPDGQWIAFASNRHAYTETLSDEDRQRFSEDPSYLMDIYIMKADGTGARRLTSGAGYDGGPFFSPDGKKIVWRKFSPDGHTAEIFTMKTDGSDVRQITRLRSMSWAPFYHPSGDYLIFTTNLHGYDNFELYIADAQGAKEPVRVTRLPGFDGLPVFHPQGHQLAWSRQLAPGQSQIFLADWDDQKARQLLQLPARMPGLGQLSYQIRAEDARRFVEFLASPELKGRATGSAEEEIYVREISRYFAALDLHPYGDNGGFVQKFEFIRKAVPGDKNALRIGSGELALGKDWTPLTFSKTGPFAAGKTVFAGYGIIAPEVGASKEYNSYRGLDVKDKWVVVFRYLPEDVPQDQRVHLSRYSRLEHKVMVARQNGAVGVVFVTGPSAKAKSDLVPFEYDRGSSIGSLPVLSVSDRLAVEMFAKAGKDFVRIQKTLDRGETVEGFSFDGLDLHGYVDIRHEKAYGANTLALLKAPGAKKTVVIGAHGDHLGAAWNRSSRGSETDKAQIHHGADDNASGVAGVLELAHYLARFAEHGKLRQNVLFAVWSGEEIGNLGSSHFAKSSKKDFFSAYLNMDMIGRLSGEVALQGVGSSPDWKNIVEEVSFQNPLPLKTQNDPYLPTDASSFYLAGIPVMSFFTGAHEDYHKPSDTADKINYEGLSGIAGYVGAVAEKITVNDLRPKYQKVEAQGNSQGRGFRIFLGTIPDYSKEQMQGVLLSGVIKGGPAELAGLRGGDVIVEFASYKIENIHDYVYSLQAIKPDEKTTIVVLRDGRKKSFSITPKSKE